MFFLNKFIVYPDNPHYHRFFISAAKIKTIRNKLSVISRHTETPNGVDKMAKKTP
jgi:hypothetical protein